MTSSTAIIIVNYHCQDHVLTCLASLAAHLATPITPIIVDNSETADYDRIALAYPDITILRPGRNLGFAGGCNIGLRHALAQNFPYLLLLNPDTRTESDFLTPMLKVMENVPELALVGPKILTDAPGRPLWNAGGRLNWWLGGQRRLLPDPPTDTAWQPADYLSGCAMLLRAKALQECGMIDEDFFLYFEDADFVHQVIKSGWQVGYVHTALLLHRVSATIGVHSRQYVYYFARNRIRFMRRRARLRHLLFFSLYNTLIKLPCALIIFGLVHRRPELAAAFVKGFIDGLRCPIK